MQEDVQHLKYMGMDLFRFSISWSRIFPSKLIELIHVNNSNNGFSVILGSLISITVIFGSLISIKYFQRDRQDTEEESMKRGSLITIISSTSCSRMVLQNHLLPLGRALFHIYVFGHAYVAFINMHVHVVLHEGMEPFVTLYHWDMPQTLEDEYGGFRSKRVV
jgi:beta-glucosidase/6-phospho-beta-glucosidase/beta-galactosidase